MSTSEAQKRWRGPEEGRDAWRPGPRRSVVVPAAMRGIHSTLGYAPAVRIGPVLHCSGQVGRTPDLAVIPDPEEQFRACWANLAAVLDVGGCRFPDVFELVTYHVDMLAHYELFKRVKAELFPFGDMAWTAIGVASLSRPGLLLEIKATALVPGG